MFRRKTTVIASGTLSPLMALKGKIDEGQISLSDAMSEVSVLVSGTSCPRGFDEVADFSKVVIALTTKHGGQQVFDYEMKAQQTFLEFMIYEGKKSDFVKVLFDYGATLNKEVYKKTKKALKQKGKQESRDFLSLLDAQMRKQTGPTFVERFGCLFCCRRRHVGEEETFRYVSQGGDDSLSRDSVAIDINGGTKAAAPESRDKDRLLAGAAGGRECLSPCSGHYGTSLGGSLQQR